jgi:NAD(P)-dependent dehydrogenase (short-subunit alcohol dehydrogenase family)
MTSLQGQVALVTGASRGTGRGIAAALAEAEGTVYVTGRSVADADLPSSIRRIPCDHRVDEAVAGVFQRIRDDRTPRQTS